MIVVEYLKRNKFWFAWTASILIILVILQVEFKLFYPPNIIRVGLVGTYQEHDLPEEVTNLTSTGLVQADSEGRIKPNLVTGWEVNNDATELKFKLRDDLRWIDNTMLKSTDLEFNIPDTSISFPDERTIQFNLKESYSALPSLLTKPIFKKGTLVGVGPYRITKIEKSRIFI